MKSGKSVKKLFYWVMFVISMALGFVFLTLFHLSMMQAAPNYTQIAILHLLTLLYLHQIFVGDKK